MPMLLRPLILKSALKAAQHHIGLPSDTNINIHLRTDYSARKIRSDARDVLIGADELVLCEYSSDVRDAPERRFQFSSLDQLIQHIFLAQIEQACTAHIATNFNLHQLAKQGRLDEVSDARSQYKAKLIKKMNLYLQSRTFKCYKWALGKHFQVNT